MRGAVNEAEGLERTIVLAGLDALRLSGGDALVRSIFGQAAARRRDELPERMPIVDYLRYRDAALAVLGTRFCDVAFETGRNLVRNLHHEKIKDVTRLLAKLEGAANKLPAVGQAAVLAARGNPGTVRARMRDDAHLLITIEACPECRGIVQDAPFCYLNQGIITEFAERHLGLHVDTVETRCMAAGAPDCEIEVTAG